MTIPSVFAVGNVVPEVLEMKLHRSLAVVPALAGLFLAACGGGTSESSAPRVDDGSPVARAEAVEAGQQLVEFNGVRFAVPAGWPVHDLAAEPTTCVRFDVNAVYLGTPSADMECPAQVIGRADAVLVEGRR